MFERRSFLIASLRMLAALGGFGRLKGQDSRPAFASENIPAARARSVSDFGATGDGLSDDTEAIQRAFDNVSGADVVVIPPRVYRVGPLKIRKSIRVEASGAAFVATPGQSRGARLIDVTADDVYIRGLALNGNEATCGYGIHAAGVSGLMLTDLRGSAFGESFLRLSRCRDGTLRTIQATRCQLNEDTTRDGVVRLQACEGVELENIQIADGQGKGLAFGSSRHCVVRALSVQRQLAQGGTCLYFNDSHHIRVDGGLLHLSQENAVKISRGSTFLHLSGLDVLTDHRRSPKAKPPCLLIMGGSDCTVLDCRFETRGAGPKQVVRIQDHQAGHSCFRNKLDKCSIVAATRSPTFRGVEFLGSDDQGQNQIVECAIRAGQGISIARGEGNRVIDCDIAATTYGVFARSASRDTIVERCTIESSTRSSAQGVRVEGSGARVVDNVIRIAGTGHCILFSGGRAKGHVAARNDCYGGGIETAAGAAAGTITGNRIMPGTGDQD